MASDGAQISYWVELRVMCSHSSEGEIRAAEATLPDPHADGIISIHHLVRLLTQCLRAVASKLVAKKYLAVYTPEKYAIWLDFTNDTHRARTMARGESLSSAVHRLSPP